MLLKFIAMQKLWAVNSVGLCFASVLNAYAGIYSGGSSNFRDRGKLTSDEDRNHKALTRIYGTSVGRTDYLLLSFEAAADSVYSAYSSDGNKNYASGELSSGNVCAGGSWGGGVSVERVVAGSTRPGAGGALMRWDQPWLGWSTYDRPCVPAR
eukprot:g1933.t1